VELLHVDVRAGISPAERLQPLATAGSAGLPDQLIDLRRETQEALVDVNRNTRSIVVTTTPVTTPTVMSILVAERSPRLRRES
jgi:hypothetical protein